MKKKGMEMRRKSRREKVKTNTKKIRRVGDAASYGLMNRQRAFVLSWEELITENARVDYRVFHGGKRRVWGDGEKKRKIITVIGCHGG